MTMIDTAADELLPCSGCERPFIATTLHGWSGLCASCLSRGGGWGISDVPTVRDDIPDRAGALLDEMDTLIAELDQALAEQATAGRRVAVVQARMRLTEAALAVATRQRGA